MIVNNGFQYFNCTTCGALDTDDKCLDGLSIHPGARWLREADLDRYLAGRSKPASAEYLAARDKAVTALRDHHDRQLADDAEPEHTGPVLLVITQSSAYERTRRSYGNAVSRHKYMEPASAAEFPTIAAAREAAAEVLISAGAPDDILTEARTLKFNQGMGWSVYHILIRQPDEPPAEAAPSRCHARVTHDAVTYGCAITGEHEVHETTLGLKWYDGKRPFGCETIGCTDCEANAARLVAEHRAAAQKARRVRLDRNAGERAKWARTLTEAAIDYHRTPENNYDTGEMHRTIAAHHLDDMVGQALHFLGDPGRLTNKAHTDHAQRIRARAETAARRYLIVERHLNARVNPDVTEQQLVHSLEARDALITALEAID